MEILKKLLILPPIALAVAVFVYVSNNKKQPEQHAASEVARAVRVIDAQKVAVVPTVRGFGVVRPGKEWVATAQVAGEIIKVDPALKKGALIKAGTVIVTISPVDYELAIAQARANIRSTDAKIREFSVSRKNTGDLLAIEKKALAIREGELARQKQLVKQGTVSRTSFDRETRDTIVQRKKVQDLENALRLLPTQLAVQKEQRAVFVAQLEVAKLNLARTKIKVPFNGRVSESDAEVAQYAQPGKTLAKVDSVATAEVEAQIPVNQMMGLLRATSGGKFVRGAANRPVSEMVRRLGLELKILLDTGTQTVSWDAKLARISDTIDPKTRTVGLIGVVEGAYSKAVIGIRPPLARGLFVEMVVTGKAHGSQIIVPRLALKNGSVFVMNKNNRLEVRAVKTGLVQDDFAVVSDGLVEGEKVVVSDLSPAVAGMLLVGEVDKALSEKIAAQAKGGSRAR